MKIQGSVAFVTGANRGLGLAFVRELLGCGAKKVYAGVRDPGAINLPGVVPVKLDVTDPASVSAAAPRCGDVTLLVNNAGIGRVNTGSEEVLADAQSIAVKRSLSSDQAYYLDPPD